MTDEIKKARGRQPRFTEAFKAEAVRLVLTSGLPLAAIARDLGICLSTLGKWVAAHKEADLLSGPHADVSKELARLRKENEILRQERDLLKNDHGFGPGCGCRNGPWYDVSLKGSDRRLIGGKVPVKKRGPWVHAYLRLVTSYVAIPIRKMTT